MKGHIHGKTQKKGADIEEALPEPSLQPLTLQNLFGALTGSLVDAAVFVQ